MAHGCLDGESATRLCAQLLTLDAEGEGPIRLELQSIEADLSAALSIIGVLDTLRVPVTAYAGGRTGGPGLGVLAAAKHRRAYPNAFFAMSEPRVSFDGPVTAVAAHEEQVRAMLSDLYARLAEVTGHEVEEIRDDARRGRLLTVEQAIDYGLIEGLAEARARPARASPGSVAEPPGAAVVPPRPPGQRRHHDRAADEDRPGHLLAQDESTEDHGDYRVDVGVGRGERERGVAQQPDVGRDGDQ